MPPQAGVNNELTYCMQLAAKKKYTDAINCLEAFKSRHPGSTASAEAELMIGDSYFRQREYLLAAETYRGFLEEYPGHSKSDYAYYRSGQAYLNETPKKIGRDQQYLDLAVQNLKAVYEYFPNSPYFPLATDLYKTARAKQAQKNYAIGRFYYKYGEYRASIPRFVEIINNYPGLGFDEASLYFIVTAYKKINLPDQAREALSLFEEKYPNSSWFKKARGKIS